MSDVIPIPSTRASEKRPIHLEFPTRSFPGQRFVLRMDWNDHVGRWTVQIEHLRRGFVVTDSMASIYRPYEYLPWLVFFFADPSGEATEVTPENLGDEVKLYALPGPSGQPPEEFED